MPKSIRTRTGAICGRWNTEKSGPEIFRHALQCEVKCGTMSGSKKRKGRNAMTEQEMRAAIAQHVKPLVCFEGLELVRCETGQITATAPVTENSLNLYGNAHGGWLYALCDTCSGMVTCTYGVPNVTLQAGINYIKGARPGDTVRVEAKTQHKGGQTAVNRVELFNQAGELLATANFTMYLMTRRG